MRKKQTEILFPLGGLNRRNSYQKQPPYTSPDCLNVRAVGQIDGRERGGSRPGLIQAYRNDLEHPIRLLKPMVLALGDGFTAWSDTFSGTSMASAWTQADWAEDMPSILPSALASVGTDVAEGAAVADLLPIDTTKAYAVELFITPWAGAFHGDYRLYLRLDNTTPDIETAGVVVELVTTGTTGAYTASLKSVVATVSTTVDTATGTISAAKPGWLTVTVSGTTVTVYWGNTEIMSGTVGVHTGSRTGFGMECSVDGGLCLANVFRVQYYSTGSVSTLRSVLVASANGALYRETNYGLLEVVTTDLTVRDDARLQAAQSGQDLYIADYGDLRDTDTDGSVAGTTFDATGVADWTALGIDAHDDVVVISDVTGTAVAGTYKIQTIAAGSLTLTAAAGTGNCSYRIERAPKVYDPSAGTVVIMTATAGQVPTGNPLICRYLDRIVMAGAEIAPHVWYMSAKSDPLDWDYAVETSTAAVAGTASAAGVPGDPITALIPHSDDYLLIACRNSLWRLRGDPAYGGSLDALSQTIGVIGPNAWCEGPNGELIFLSLDGLYAIDPGGESYPVPISREALPHEFLNLNPDILTISLEYDVSGRGVHIYLTPESSNARLHWWMDWDRKTFWPVSLDEDHEPTATCSLQSMTIEDSGVLLGGRDGIIRRLSDLAETDCGTAFTTYAIIGPLPLSTESRIGVLESMEAIIAEGSGDVTWGTYPSLTAEGTLSATVSDTGTWSAGLNAVDYPSCCGAACAIKLTGTSGRRWEFEGIPAVIRDAGKRRIA